MDNHTPRETPADGAPQSGHEPNTLSLKAAGLFVFILLVLIIGSQPIVAWLLRASGGERHPSIPLASFDPGTARNWNHPEADLAALRKEEDEHLTRYTWLDRTRGLVRIPIAEAMKLLAEGHGAHHPDGSAPSPETTTRGLPDEDKQHP